MCDKTNGAGSPTKFKHGWNCYEIDSCGGIAFGIDRCGRRRKGVSKHHRLKMFPLAILKDMSIMVLDIRHSNPDLLCDVFLHHPKFNYTPMPPHPSTNNYKAIFSSLIDMATGVEENKRYK